MEDLKIKGRIEKIIPGENGISKSGKEWANLQFVINTEAQYNPEVCFKLFGTPEKVENFKKFNKVGDNVIVSFNVSSREYNGKYYNDLSAWRVDKQDLPF